MTDAEALLARLAARGWTVGVAESLTGGLVTAELVAIPGASAVVRGGVVAYATDVKRTLLRVDAELLEAQGAVDPAVALEMAQGVREAVSADVGIATTGVAGPEPQDGKPVGTVCIAVVTPEGATAETKVFTGDREAIRRASAEAALAAGLALV